ncbi:MAG: hypothetical protein NT067_01070 [Candidatus Diapherotrites archaeon]|nr:hypothetical protein [Candidatus Diapherotrites archaeon]
MDTKVEELKSDLGKIKGSLNSISVSTKKKKISNDEAAMGFLIQQLDSVLLEVDNLDKAVALGIPLTEYEGNISKLSKAENDLKSLDSQMNSLVSEVQELRRKEDELNTLLKEGISERQVKMFEGRIKNLEELQQKLMSGRSTKVVIELVSIIDDLNQRLKRLEELFKVASSEQTMGATIEINMESQPTAQPAKKEGFFSKLAGFFKRS